MKYASEVVVVCRMRLVGKCRRAAAIAAALSAVVLSISSAYLEVNAYSHGHFENSGVAWVVFTASILLSVAGVWISIRNGRNLFICVSLAVLNLLIHVFVPALFGALEAALAKRVSMTIWGG